MLETWKSPCLGTKRQLDVTVPAGEGDRATEGHRGLPWAWGLDARDARQTLFPSVVTQNRTTTSEQEKPQAPEGRERKEHKGH